MSPVTVCTVSPPQLCGGGSRGGGRERREKEGGEGRKVKEGENGR